MKKLVLIPVLLMFVFFISNAEEQKKHLEVGLDEQLGTTIPLDAVFNDENGNQIQLSSIVNQPTLFMLVYYRCPGICNPLMNEVSTEIQKIDLKPGKDYKLVCVSFDETEDYQVARDKKKNYLKGVNIALPDSAWRFLTGDYKNIHKLTDAFGFWYKKQEDGQFIHPGAIMFVSPEGKITRYLLGTDFLPADIKMALLESSKGTISPTISKLISICFNYDPNGRKYVLDVTRVAGISTILTAAIVITFLVRRPKRKKTNDKIDN